ncbi:hypothetical protein ACEZDB_26885 [Streptacidiphilus sp. N1-3]|uniref:Uncharacterized protein n=1 Tax=Streptacidiphilus alkalitolerans TaxID=3342712 RepID=A0ABV6X7L0_9ACTN
MPMMQIISQAGRQAHGPFQVDNPDTLWWFEGVGYTDNPALIRYFEATAGYTVTEGSPDEDHLAGVADLKDQAKRGSYCASSSQDALDPAHRAYR